MNGAGLSLDQAPPFGLPLRLFLLAPLFLLLAAGVGLPTAGSWTASRWSGASLALTHLLTLGVLATAMGGALLQLLPVLLGTAVPRAGPVAAVLGAGLGGGTPLLALGLGLGSPAALGLGALLLAAGLFPFLAAVGVGLARALAQPRVGWPVRQAWLALLVTVVAGLLLVGGLAGGVPVRDSIRLTHLHAAWGLGGWVLILVVGVAYQVVPMLQLTPAYPARLTRWLSVWLLAGLLLYSAALWWGVVPAGWAALPACLAALLFAWVTLDLQRRRRRQVADTTLAFWRLGMWSLGLAALAVPGLEWVPEAGREGAQLSLGILFLLGFAVAVVNGMLYKIVPFLAWFHLQAQTGARAGSIPNMKQFVPDAAARRQYRLHLAAVLLLLPAPFLPPAAAAPGLVCLAASAHQWWLNLVRARRLFLAFGGRL